MAIIGSKFYSWANKYCPKPISSINNAVDIAYAVDKAYAPSVHRALWQNGKHCGFNGMTKEKNQARAQATHIIECYLQYVYNYNLLPYSVTDLWDKVRDVYYNNRITWYTYGNAQKWVAMSIKYYLVAKYYNTPNNLCNDVLADVVFPVDSIMINKIKNGKNSLNLKIPFKCNPTKCHQYTNCTTKNSDSWAKCDCKQKFIDYIDAVKNALIKFPTQDKLIEFEIDNW